jgi:hypothetical protein
MLGVLVAATRYGLPAGLSTGVLSALAFDYFFLPPHGSLSIASAEDLLVLAVFAATAAVASTAATGERHRAESARTAERVARRDRDLAAAVATAVGLDDGLSVPSTWRRWWAAWWPPARPGRGRWIAGWQPRPRVAPPGRGRPSCAASRTTCARR